MASATFLLLERTQPEPTLQCVECQQPTTVAPCSVCGQEPRVDGRYQLERRLGSGSFGVVYRGIDCTTGDIVAVKEVLLGGLDTTKARELAQREGAVLRQLSHPGIPAWRDEVVVGVGRAATLYLVQEFIDGENLHDGLASKRWSEDEVLGLMDEVLDILHYLHTRHPPVLHRDIKPGNLIRTADGRLVLVDFGSVRDALRSTGMGGSTVAGTFGFMAPEQFQGDAWPTTDLYGLGMTAVALLGRVEPARFHSRTRQVDWERHVSVSGATRDLLRALLQPEPEARLQSAVAVRKHIARIWRTRAGSMPSSPKLETDDLILPPLPDVDFPAAHLAPPPAIRPLPSPFAPDPDLQPTDLVPHAPSPLARRPPATSPTEGGVGGRRPGRVVPRKGPGFAKGCLFTVVFIAMVGAAGLVLLPLFAESWPVFVGL